MLQVVKASLPICFLERDGQEFACSANSKFYTKLFKLRRRKEKSTVDVQIPNC